MRLFILVFLILPTMAFCQKMGNNWILGSSRLTADTADAALLVLNFDAPNVFTKLKRTNGDMYLSNSSISSHDGQLRFFSNGASIFNTNADIIPNGGQLPANSTWHDQIAVPQAALFLPLPGHEDSTFFLTSDRFTYFDSSSNILTGGVNNYTYTVIKHSLDNGLGAVVERKTNLISDTLLGGQITACKHANGRDWWSLAFRFNTHAYYPILYTPEGPIVYPLESLSSDFMVNSGQSAFSLDGNWFARYSIAGEGPAGFVDIYQFDRCTGKLYNHLHKKIGDGWDWGGIAFSPNSRYLYAAAIDSIYQYDLSANDIFGSQELVAVYDDFIHDLAPNDTIHDVYARTRFFHMQTAPDGKIYISVPNINTFYIHTIENPDEGGILCNVAQHSLHLPVPTNPYIPNVVNYYMGPIEGSACDTLETVGLNNKDGYLDLKHDLYPNPSSGQVVLSMDGIVVDGFELQIFNNIGQLEVRKKLESNKVDLDFSKLLPGLYFYKIRNRKGDEVFFGKLVLI